MRRVSIIFFLFISLFTAYAVRAYPYPIQVTQPDGSTLSILIKGDEFFHYTTTLGGHIIAQGADKYYYYASYDTGRLILSSHRVSPYSARPSSLSSTSFPKEVAIRTREANIRLFSMAPSSKVKSYRTVVIPVQFYDVKFSISPARQHFENMINQKGYSENGATGSAKDYFDDNLKDSVDIRFDVADVVTLPNTLAYYGSNSETDSLSIKYDVNIKQFVKDACSKADPFVDFSQYNSVFIYYAGYSEAEGGGADAIWPLSWDMNSTSLVLDGAKISAFSCASELHGADGNSPSGIGIFCHEFGHILGLVDLYDTDYEEGGQGKGLWGSLSLMDFGCYNNKGRTPPYFCAIDRELVGYSKILSFDKGKTYTLGPINEKFEIYKVNTTVKDEYFLFEVRQEEGWDRFIGGNGMLIYHIDKSNNVAGSITSSVRWRTNTINCFSGHECADLVEAMPSAVSVKQIFFPGTGNVSEITSVSNPPLAGWNLHNVGIKLTNIKSVMGGVSFLVSEDNDEKLLNVINPSINAFQQEAVVTWESDMNILAKWGVRWKLNNESVTIYNERTVNKKECRIDGLEGGKDYLCELYYIGNTNNGDTLRVNFKTIEVNSPYPFIYGIKNKYSVGDTIDLRLFNILDAVNSISWFVDDRPVPGGQYIFQSTGKKVLSVEIEYSLDKSVETIKRSVNVIKNKDDE